MPFAYRAALLCLAALLFSGLVSLVSAGSARAEIFYCQSTRSPNGSAKYCNFLLFDRSFSRHRQVIVAQGARREVAINGRYDLFCVLVQNTRDVPDNFAYRKQQCRKTDTGREYKVPIRALNMRRGRDGFSTDAIGSLLPDDSW
ncbi:hypothetical protein [Roseibium sediminicola]|uniref:Secreted protein n=1 Tax=Roseibium sediminicola TaxID=2933272 RepID=A0ABT0GQY5_9HYPH|nr:hypothetical protein [Roseibium sp. CAU 1639]MCK7611843.1 hypothetical protein [Roseibium sp. CAU 1639]